MKAFRRLVRGKVGDHILGLEWISAGKCDKGRSLTTGDDEAGLVPENSREDLVGTEVQQP